MNALLEDPRLTVSVTEASVMLGISRNSAYKAVYCGEIPSIKIGDRTLIPKAALAKMLGITWTPLNG